MFSCAIDCSGRRLCSPACGLRAHGSGVALSTNSNDLLLWYAQKSRPRSTLMQVRHRSSIEFFVFDNQKPSISPGISFGPQVMSSNSVI